MISGSDNDFFTEVSEHFSEYYRLPPLTAKIYTLLIFNNNKEGLSFEDIQNHFQSSKSSASTSISTLLEFDFIEQIRRANERKRYFRINRNYFLTRLTRVEKMLSKDKLINDRLKEYLGDKSKCVFEEETHNLFLELVEKNIVSIQETIQKIKKK